MNSNAPPLPPFPWQDRPAGSDSVLWRHSANPVIGRNPAPGAARVFNSAVIPWEQGYLGVFRCDLTRGGFHLRLGRSPDGLAWSLDPDPIRFASTVHPDDEPVANGYDPRVVKIDDDYFITWCAYVAGGPTIALARTRDFQTFDRLEHAFLPSNRNGVLFPRKIGGNYVMLSRPSDQGHTPFGEIHLSESPDLLYWGKHRHVMGTAGRGSWEMTKIGAGPVPIETPEGWLMLYHGVTQQCNGMIYSIGAALLDLDDPARVIARSRDYLMTPETPYEETGAVPNVVFPVATLVDGPSGRLALYYGAADSVTALACGHVREIVDFVKQRNG